MRRPQRVSFAPPPAWCSVDRMQLQHLGLRRIEMSARKLLLGFALILCVGSFGCCRCPLSCCPFSSSQPTYACCYPAQPSCPTCCQYPRPCQMAAPMCSMPMSRSSGWDSCCTMPCHDDCCGDSCGSGSCSGGSCCGYGGSDFDGFQPMMGCGTDAMNHDPYSNDGPPMEMQFQTEPQPAEAVGSGA
jgi:hypothetical protein